RVTDLPLEPRTLLFVLLPESSDVVSSRLRRTVEDLTRSIGPHRDQGVVLVDSQAAVSGEPLVEVIDQTRVAQVGEDDHRPSVVVAPTLRSYAVPGVVRQGGLEVGSSPSKKGEDILVVIRHATLTEPETRPAVGQRDASHQAQPGERYRPG